MLKHTKKVVSIPESEYNALLGLLTAGEPMKKEKVITDEKIKGIIRNPKITALEKGVKYQSLFRKRNKINRILEEKPMKVLMETGKASVMPTTGIAPATITEQQIQDVQHNMEPPVENAPPIVEEPPINVVDKILQFKGKINKRFSRRLYEYVDENRDLFGITEDGKLISNMSKSKWEIPQKNANLNNVLNYIVGHAEHLEDKNSAKILLNRFFKNDEIKKYINLSKQQTGEGKRKYVVDLKSAPIKRSKTRGLVRFKPILWSKIPI